MRLHFPKIAINAGAVALIALAVQAASIFVPLGFDDVPKRLLFQLSYLLLIFFVAANWRRIGILIIGLGLVLNLAAIVANGGLMPVTREALVEIGKADRIEGLKDGDAIPKQKEVLKSRENTRLYFLSDRLVWDNPLFPLFSIGDAVTAAGLVVTAADLLLPRLRRSSFDKASTTPTLRADQDP